MNYLMMMYPLVMSCGVGGSLIGILYSLGKWIWDKIMHNLYSCVTINFDDDTFKHVLKYLQDKELLAHDNVLFCKIKKNDLPWWEQMFEKKDEKKAPEVDYSPGSGMHKFVFNGRTMFVHHQEGQVMMTGWDRTPTSCDKLHIYTFGNDCQPIRDFVQATLEHSVQKDDGLVCIYELHRWGIGWTKAQKKRPRGLDSVVLDKEKSLNLIKDIKLFQDSSEWYLNNGIPYRRGYLLHGPPGTGKTSMIQAVAGELKLNICYLNLSSGNLDDDGLNRALNDAPGHSIILLEDIDAIFVQRHQVTQNQHRRSVTFSGLLNALDGVRS